jgi:hypothetical protein
MAPPRIWVTAKFMIQFYSSLTQGITDPRACLILLQLNVATTNLKYNSSTTDAFLGNIQHSTNKRKSAPT